MSLSVSLSNRIGFAVLGLTNNFAYVIMLSAAYDLLKQIQPHPDPNEQQANSSVILAPNSTDLKPYCNAHSTSTILLADTLPSLATKLLYPFLLVQVPTAYKAIGTAFLSAISFIITGLSSHEILIFTGVICASFSSGLGESTYLSNTPLYGDVSLTGWSIGTGGAGLLGAGSYALLTMILPIKFIMIIMLIVPTAMMAAYFCLIKPVHDHEGGSSAERDNDVVAVTSSPSANKRPVNDVIVLTTSSNNQQQTSSEAQEQHLFNTSSEVKLYGGQNGGGSSISEPPLDTFRDKFFFLPALAKYFLPLLLVYFAEYFINQGLFELIYYPEITFLEHAAQYRWFQVTYQLGVFISRSSLDILKIRNLWTMSLLQLANAILFLAHASKLIHIPSFYIVLLLIVYEGLLGGFTYVNAFYRVKKEVAPDRREFGISAVTVADSLGIVFAALLALPTHDALCKLYQ